MNFLFAINSLKFQSLITQKSKDTRIVDIAFCGGGEHIVLIKKASLFVA